MDCNECGEHRFCLGCENLNRNKKFEGCSDEMKNYRFAYFS